MTNSDLPKTIYVAFKSAAGNEPDFLVAETDVTQLAELQRSERGIGRYQLIETASLNGVPLLDKWVAT